MARPWGGIDPNSQHQLWSSWTFRVETSRTVPLEEVKLNAARWLRKGFGSVGQARVLERLEGRQVVYVIEARVEGAPAHDPGYVASVERGFTRFVDQGFGPLARGTVAVQVLAGDQQDGKAASKLVVLPGIH